MSSGIRNLSNEVLFEQTQKLTESERKMSTDILHHLAEINRRRVYIKRGHSSLWDYVIKDLKYNEGAAYRRIAAMRALQVHPELEEKINQGSLSVSTVCQVQCFLQDERNQASKTYSSQQRIELFKKCENKSAREVTRELATLSPLAIRVQKERVITENRTVVSFLADANLLEKIHRVRDLSAARLKNPNSYPELIDLMSDVTLDEIDLLRKPAPKPALRSSVKNFANSGKSEKHAKSGHSIALITSKQVSTQRNSRYIPQALRIALWKEANGRCTFISPETGSRCESTFGLEIEHCQPHAFGGSSTDLKNLRLLCRKHNQWQAIQSYGFDKMQHHLEKTSID